MKKIVISGANGFIGSWLIKELEKEKKYTLFPLVRENSDISHLPDLENGNIVKVDYDNFELLEKVIQGADVYIHLIGQMGGYGIPQSTYEYVNVELTKRMLQLCEKCKVRQFVFCSTPGVQGFGHRLAAEEEAYAPRNLYEKTKVQAEQLIIKFCKTSAMKYTIIRPDFVYGPGDYRRVKMYRSIKNRKFVLTTNGKSWLHPTYILDVVQGFSKVIDNPGAFNEVFNISADNDVTALEFLNTIAACVDSKLIHINIGYRLSVLLAEAISVLCEHILHKEAFVSKNKIDFLAVNHSTSNEKAKRKLSFCPDYPLKRGMKATIEWCREENLLN